MRRWWAERRAGELLAETEKDKGGRPAENSSHRESGFRLQDIGIGHNQSHRWQQIATLATDIFEPYMESAKTWGELRHYELFRPHDDWQTAAASGHRA
jgi:hypothetical protein